MASWQALAEELAHWQAAGRAATLWWRDDDAERNSPALERLNQLSLDYRVTLALAVIPAGAEDSLLTPFERNPQLVGLQHGYAHRSHAPKGERNCELGDHRPLVVIEQELADGQQRLRQLLGGRFYPLLVPPWNRLGDEVVARLAALGFAGLSTLGPRSRKNVAELNVHVDLIDWRAGRQFMGDERVLAQLTDHLQARRLGLVDAEEATGVMTHHLAHDEGCWRFLAQLLGFTAQQPAVRWIDPRTAFHSQA